MRRAPYHDDEGHRRITTIEDLRPGDHLCCIYETDDEHGRLVTPYMASGLERNEKVFYIVDARTAAAVLGYLREAGVTVEPYLESGQLSILSADEAYMRTGVFDPDGMIDMLREKTAGALDEGYDACRITGEMSWALRGLPGSDRLIEYEAKLNDFFPGSRALAICQYDRRLFEPGILLHVLTTHPIAVIGTRIYENPYFMPPGDFFRDDREQATLEQWFRNLEERQDAFDALRDSEEKYRGLFDNMLEGFAYCRMLFDEENRPVDWEYLEVNKAFGPLTGLEDVKGKRVSEVIPDLGETNPELFDYYGRVADTGEPIRFDTRLEQLDLDLSIKVFSPEEGYFVAVFENVTDRKRTERRLQQVNTELEGFAHTVSHDLKGPLSAIGVAVDLLEKLLEGAPLSPELRADVSQTIGISGRNVERASRLIEDLLVLAESGRELPEVEEVEVAEVVRQIVESRELLLGGEDVSFEVWDDLGRVRAGRTHVYQLFANLVDNAIRHAGTDHLVITIARLGRDADGAHRFQVRDNGVGLSEEDLDLIFLPFYKGGPEGSGIGLATVSKIVDVYGGRIEAYNDGGACFEFTLFDAGRTGGGG